MPEDHDTVAAEDHSAAADDGQGRAGDSHGPARDSRGPAASQGPATGESPTAGADRGAAAERTRLAWRRTALSATGVGLLLARPAVRPGAGATAWLVAALAMAAWAALTGLAYRRARGLRARPPVPGRRGVAAYALITAALAVLGCLVVTL